MASTNSSKLNLKILQINLRNSKAASPLMAAFLELNNYDIALLQDAHTIDKNPSGVPSNWKVFSSAKGSAHIVVRKPDLVLTFLHRSDTTIFITITTETEKLIIGSQYIPPSAHFDNSLNEWSGLITQNFPLVMGGDLNANSPLWGSPHEDVRGQELVDFLLVNNLTLGNTEDCPPTFQTLHAVGWPDFTLVNQKAQAMLNSWKVLPDHNDSDHNYISFEISCTPHITSNTRLKTEHGSHSKFKKHFKEYLGHLSDTLKRSTTTETLDSFTEQLIKTIYAAGKATYRIKRTSTIQAFNWWTPQLRKSRNRLTAMRKRLKTIPIESQASAREYYREQRAQYRKEILQTKRMLWKQYCTKNTSEFGHLQKIFSGKVFKPTEIEISWTDGQTRKDSMILLTETLFGTKPTLTDQGALSSSPSSSGTPLDFDAPADLPFTKSEVKNALYALNVKKAPGPDSVDFRLLRLAHEVSPGLFTNWANACLNLNYFPLGLRSGEVVYFQKQGKNPSEATSYRPICLLPTLGKFLEKLLVQRLNYFLETGEKLSNKLFGFREGRSCEKALSEILSSSALSVSEGNYTTLVSLDIKGAFDNVPWNTIINSLIKLKCPRNIGGVIRSYLSDRSVLVNWGSGSQTHEIWRGCPQGSCLGPILWNLVANEILQEAEQRDERLYAYADDFTYVFSGKRRLDLEQQANTALTAFVEHVGRLGLQISPNKSQAMTFAKPRLLKRMPIMRVQGVSVQHTQAIKILGISIDRRLTWFSHFNNLKTKLLRIYLNAHRLAPKSWGTSTEILKVWYRAIVERILLYGAGIWGGNLSGEAEKKLLSIQRPFLLLMARSYKTAPSAALSIITGQTPINIMAKAEYEKTRILHLGDTEKGSSLLGGRQLMGRVPRWTLHPASEISDLQVNTKIDNYTRTFTTEVFTDGSKTANGVASAFCVMENQLVIHRYNTKLLNDNSVFQAELLAIQKALVWIHLNRKGVRVCLFTDSLSALHAIRTHRTDNPLVLDIKYLLLNLKQTKLLHVKAHKGTTGNEEADRLAKEATERTETETNLPAPRSLIKRKISILKNQWWEDHWNNSDTGRYTYKIFNKPINPNKLNFNLIPPISAFLLGHGPFPAYLNRFRLKSSGLCECGRAGDPWHYFLSCPLTSDWHLKEPHPEHLADWALSVVRSPRSRNFLLKIYDKLTLISNLTS